MAELAGLLATWRRVGQLVAIAIMDACDAAHLDRVAALYHGELRQR